MASIKQINFAKSLLGKADLVKKDFILEEDIPGPIVGKLIDRLLAGETPNKDNWNKTVEKYVYPDDVEEDKNPFSKELLLIESSFIQGFVKKLLTKVPDYFYTTAASSTGKYHPEYCLGKGGLLRHTKAAVMIAQGLFDNPLLNTYTQEERDIIIAALILHDTVKHGLGGSTYTVTEHPLLVEKLIDHQEFDESYEEEQAIILKILGCIKSHMGPWNKDYKTKKEVLPLPKTKMQIFVHLCDYLASRKFLEVKFD